MKQNQQNPLLAMAGRAGISLLLSWSAAIVICMIGAWLISMEKIPETASGYCSLLAVLISAMLGSLLTIKREAGNLLLQSILHGAVFFVSLLCMGILLFDGSVNGVGATALLTLGGSLVAFLLKMNKKERGFQRRRKYKIKAFVQN